MIVVKAEPRLKRVHVRMGGMLTVQEVALFSREEQDAVRAMGLGSGEFDKYSRSLRQWFLPNRHSQWSEYPFQER